MGEEAADAEAEASARKRRRRRRWLTQESVGAAALILSLSIAGVNAWQAMRGADIVALPPEEVVFYRDAGPVSAGLSIAVRAPLMNRAGADYADVVTDVVATLHTANGRAAPAFAHQSIAEPIFTQRDTAMLAQACDVRVRCVPLTGMLVIERLRQVVDLPGGAVRDQHFGFVLDRAYCRPAGAVCADYRNFDGALAALANRPLRVSIAFEFSGDRTRGVTCATTMTAAHAAYLRRTGWVALPCSSSR